MAQGQFSPQERNMMRQDALRRAREMRSRQQPEPPPPPPPPEPKAEAPRPASTRPQPAGGLFSNLEQQLGGILHDLDSDSLLILALLWMVHREGGEWPLLAALAYVAL